MLKAQSGHITEKNGKETNPNRETDRLANRIGGAARYIKIEDELLPQF